MAFDPYDRSTADLDTVTPQETHRGGGPGKRPVTAGLSGRPQTNIVLRVENAEAANALAGAFGPRDPNGVAAGADVAVDRAASSSGSALPEDLRGQFESSLGADLSSVRIHTGGESAEAASAVGAKAYTTGNDVHFAAGQYDPSSAFGVHLLAHEVAHTQQQAGATPTRQHKLEVSTPGDHDELEADHAADAMVTGAPVAVSSAGAKISREPDKDAKPGDAKPDDKGGKDAGAPAMFRPQFTVDPDVLLAPLNDDVAITVGISNAAAAPPGTKFSYKWTHGDGKVVRAISSDITGPTSSFKGKTTGVGTKAIPVEVSVEEADAPGLGIVHKVPSPQVTVDEPEIGWVEVSSGKGNGPMDMRPGDTHLVEADIKGVVAPKTYGNVNVQLATNSFAMDWGSVPQSIRPATVSQDGEALTMDEAPASNADSVAYQVSANRAGEGDLTMTIELPGAKTQEQVIKLKVAATADQFHKRCTVAIARHASLVSLVAAYCNQVAAAYNTGYQEYQAVLGDRAAREKLEQEIMLNILFAGAGGFVGGAVGAVVKGPVEKLINGPVMRGALTDAPKDLAKYTARLPAKFAGKGGSADIDAGVSGGGGGGGGKAADPFTWANGVEQKANVENAAVSEQIKTWMEAAQKVMDAGSDETFDFDPVDAVNDSTRIGDTRIDAIGDIPTALHYEQGFWNSWVQQYGHVAKADLFGLSMKYHVEENTGPEVDERIKLINEKMWELNVGNGWYHKAMSDSKDNAEADVERRNKEADEELPLLL